MARENSLPEISKLTQRGRLLETQFRMNKLVYDEIKYEIEKIYQIIDNANQDIEILEIQNNSYEMSDLLIQMEVEATAEKMFYDLSNSINKFTKKAYKKVYGNLTQTLDEVLGNYQKEFIEDEDFDERELYDIINPWLNNFKEWLFNNINSAFDDLSLETKSYVQKGIFSDTFENIKNTFGKVN